MTIDLKFILSFPALLCRASVQKAVLVLNDFKVREWEKIGNFAERVIFKKNKESYLDS